VHKWHLCGKRGEREALMIINAATGCTGMHTSQGDPQQISSPTSINHVVSQRNSCEMSTSGPSKALRHFQPLVFAYNGLIIHIVSLSKDWREDSSALVKPNPRL